MKGKRVAVWAGLWVLVICNGQVWAEPEPGQGERPTTLERRQRVGCRTSSKQAAGGPVKARTHVRKIPAAGTVSVDVLGFSQLGPSLDLEFALPRRTSLGLSARWTQAGWLSHYLPDLYPGEGKLHFSYQVGIRFRTYLSKKRPHHHAGLFFGAIVEFFRYKFEEGEGTWWAISRQTVQMLCVGGEFGYRWDFRSGLFISFYGAIAVPVVLTLRVVGSDGEVETTDRKDADNVPPVAGRLSLGLGFYF